MTFYYNGIRVGLAMEWAARHREELLENWERARRQEPLERIPPLE
jgi:hypothetical protein